MIDLIVQLAFAAMLSASQPPHNGAVPNAPVIHADGTAQYSRLIDIAPPVPVRQ